MDNSLKLLYEEMYKDLAGTSKLSKLTTLGKLLAKTIGRKPNWTAHHLNAVIMGYDSFVVTPELERAIQIVGMRRDGQPEIQAKSRQISVFTVNGIEPDSVVFGHTVLCYCQRRVVFNHPGRKYCFEECKLRARRERKAKAGA